MSIHWKEDIFSCVLDPWATKSLMLTHLFICWEYVERLGKKGLQRGPAPTVERLLMEVMPTVQLLSLWWGFQLAWQFVPFYEQFSFMAMRKSECWIVIYQGLMLLLLLFFRIACLIKLLVWGPAVVFDCKVQPGSEWCQNRIWQMLFKLPLKTWLQTTQVQYYPLTRWKSLLSFSF